MTGKFSFLTDSCKFPMKEIIMGAGNFNFGFKLTQNGDFRSQILHFWTKRFSDYFLTAQNLG